MITVCFDVDGTLIYAEGMKGEPDTPRYDVLAMLFSFKSFGARIFIWSGGGEAYAQMWARKLGLEDCPARIKGALFPDIAVDDENVSLGKVNIRV